MNNIAKIDSSNVLLLPGWHGNALGHWQTRWASRHGYPILEQNHWDRPLRGDWMTRLEDTLLGRPAGAPPVTLVGHSLGCLLVAAWASHSRNTALVGAALLVAPPDTETPALSGVLRSWSPIPLQRLPFRTHAIVSTDDPHASVRRSLGWAAAWGSTVLCIGGAGHLNAQSGLGNWDAGHAQLLALMA